MSTTSTTRLCLVRHGETSWNAEGRVQGQTDVPLSELGHAQARAVAATLAGERFEALYTSDLVRVRQTAQPAAETLGLAARAEKNLRERHYGQFEALTYREAKERFPEEYARFRERDPEFDFGGGESLRAFQQRTIACVAAIAAQHPGAAVLVFTHGGVLEMVFRRAAGRTLSSARDFELPNAALNWVEIGAHDWRVQAWAKLDHLGSASGVPSGSSRLDTDPWHRLARRT
ncbi:MAG: histidine phosphatase family protein [Betaproteobacteria bacterium]|nr:histidine phosphatase family protein [Betaproteobacteria bacterium]